MVEKHYIYCYAASLKDDGILRKFSSYAISHHCVPLTGRVPDHVLGEITSRGCYLLRMLIAIKSFVKYFWRYLISDVMGLDRLAHYLLLLPSLHVANCEQHLGDEAFTLFKQTLYFVHVSYFHFS